MLVIHPLAFLLVCAQAPPPAQAPTIPADPSGRAAVARVPPALLLPHHVPGPAHGPWRSSVRWCAKWRDLHLVWDHESYCANRPEPSQPPLENRVDFLPEGVVTACLCTDSGELVLALLDDEGAPRLERWELSWRPGEEARLVRSQDGSTLPAVQPECTAVHSLWSTRDPRYGAIDALALVRRAAGPSVQLLVHFTGSDEIASLPSWGGRLETLLSEVSGPPPERGATEPRPRPVHEFVVVDRLACGFVYGLQARLGGLWCGSGSSCLASGLQPRVPCLFDPAGDGLVDRSERVPFAEWERIRSSDCSASARER